MIQFLIDADLAIYAMGGAPDSALNKRIALCFPGEVAISAISFAEVALGTWNGKPPRQDVLEAFIKAIPLIAFDEAAARAYAGLSFKRAQFDRLLAAHALSLDVVIVTNNEADFADVSGLRTENWVG